jgi:hypothetical protein
LTEPVLRDVGAGLLNFNFLANGDIDAIARGQRCRVHPIECNWVFDSWKNAA